TDGYTGDTYCIACGAKVADGEVIPASHTWDEGVVTTEPTCSSTGVKTYTCATCGDTKTENIAIDLSKHSYGEWIDAVEATCSSEGVVAHKDCTLCGKHFDENNQEIATVVVNKNPENHEGETEIRDKVDATCATPGYTGDTYCIACNTKIQDGTATEIDPTKHEGETQIQGKVDATCTTDGYTGDTYCIACGAKVADGEVIPASHTWDEGVVTTEPTCTETGVKTYTCAVCGETKEETLEASGHEIVDTGVVGYTKCSVCGTWFENFEVTFTFGANGNASHFDGSDLGASKSYTEGDYTLALTGMSKVSGGAFDAMGNSALKLGTGSVTATLTFAVPEDITKVTIYVAKYKNNATVVSVNGVNYTINTASNDGEYTAIEVDTTTTKTITFATTSSGKRAMIDKIVFGKDGGVHTHTEEIIPAEDSTCTETGLTEGKKCSVCGTVLVEQVVTEAKGHTEETVTGTPATCTETGLTEGKKCSVCGEILVAQETIPATGHNDEDEDNRCDACGTTMVPCDHANKKEEGMNHVEAVAATCTEAGTIAYYTCDFCSDRYAYIDSAWTKIVSDDQLVASALGHTEVVVPGTPATCTESGLTDGLECSVCGVTLTEQTVISALGHDYVDGTCSVCGEKEPVVVPEVTFTFGENGAASHVDGNSLGASKSYTEGEYSLDLTSMTNVYGPAYDAKGNSAIKLGTSSKTGSFSFTVPADVTKVVIHVAQYKANTTKIDVNGTAYTISTASNNGAYTAVEVDTSTNKTVTFATVSGGVRAMIDKIVYVLGAGGGEVEPPHEHEWGEGEITTEPTCKDEGVKTYTCACGETKTEEVEKLAHTESEWIVDKDATCAEAGSKHTECTVCGETVNTEVISATGEHTWNDATCTAPKTCSVCGATDGEELGHTWVDADCDTPKTCSVCGETEGEALGHAWVDADCDTPKTCSVCGETEGEALGHDWNDATCTAPKTCSVCGETEGEALGH
ncbi:MAG: hypothetical protein IJX70_03240, partial [Clostridia bacterium]|nr:hypothetical protein [Clostridia bacterium]